MSGKIPARLLWAAENLEVAPDDQVLEIGCGHGVAASLVCQQLTSGKLTAIDRSETMIETASKRNQEHIRSGKAAFYTAALDNADFDGARFDKIFAVNVNLFWIEPAKELAAMRRLLKPDGTLYLFFQPPTASKMREIADLLTQKLEENYYSILDLTFKEIDSAWGLCLIAKPIQTA